MQGHKFREALHATGGTFLTRCMPAPGYGEKERLRDWAEFLLSILRGVERPHLFTHGVSMRWDDASRTLTIAMEDRDVLKSFVVSMERVAENEETAMRWPFNALGIALDPWGLSIRFPSGA